MKKELLLVRHGKSDWNIATDDFHRPLKKRGKIGAKKLGLWLQEHNLQPDYVLSSPARRAVDTTKKLITAMQGKPNLMKQEQRLYAANSNILKKVLTQCPADVKRVLMVGHNPELEYLLLNLVDAEIAIPDDGKLLPTATLAHLKLASDWQALTSGCAQLQCIIRATWL